MSFLRIALVANNLKRVDQEMRRFYEMNREDIYSYRKFNQMIIFKDGTILRGHTIKDNEWMRGSDYDQLFLTHDLEYSKPLLDLFYRMESRSYIPSKYLFMLMEED